MKQTSGTSSSSGTDVLTIIGGKMLRSALLFVKQTYKKIKESRLRKLLKKAEKVEDKKKDKNPKDGEKAEDNLQVQEQNEEAENNENDDPENFEENFDDINPYIINENEQGKNKKEYHDDEDQD